MSRFHSLQLLSKRPETERAMLLTFSVPKTLQQAFRGEPGQHVVLRAMIDGQEHRRTYSVCARSHSDDFSICVRSDGGGRMTGLLCRGLEPGQSIEVLPPTGRFILSGAPAGTDYLLLAAGIGITPLIAIAGHLLSSRPDARVTLLYGNRDTEGALFIEELQALKDRYVTRLALHFFMSREPQDLQVYDGRISAAKLRELAGRCYDPRALAAAFLCAPPGLLSECTDVLQQLGVPAARIHAEHFVTSAVDSAIRPGASGLPEMQPVVEPRPAASPAGGRTRVTVRMDGRAKTFDMPRAGSVSVLDAAESAGLELPYSCKGGVCSTCRTHVVSGTVSMLQNYALEESEVAAGFVLACQSIPSSEELELDYDTR